MVKALIMAGGIGERLWPLSTREKPKQFHAFGSENSMIEETIKRLKNFVDDVLIVSTKEQLELFRELLPDFPGENLILEPFGRNTAPAIALGSLSYDDDDIMVVVPSDHLIRDPEKYEATMREAIREAEENPVLITIGINPTRPDTGYGYIERGRIFDRGAGSYTVESFHEKPSLRIAENYLERGGFYWNSGMFVWKKSTFITALATHLPEVYRGLTKVCAEPAELERVYEALPKISIDYGIMEKADNTVVIPGYFYWNDIGSWDSVYDLEEKDGAGNVVKGPFIINNVSNSLLINTTETPLGLSDIENSVVISSKNGTLICERGRTQNVREITKRLG